MRTRQRWSAYVEQVVERIDGMCLLALATVTTDGRPIVGPVDAIFYRGAFHFGSAPDSLPFRHIRARPSVSATYLPSEALVVTVHGRARPLDIQSETDAGFRQTLLDIYVPRSARSGRTSSTPARCTRASKPTACSRSRWPTG